MEEWKKDGRRDVVMVDLDALVPKDHLLRKIERVMDYDWLYERLDPYYCHDDTAIMGLNRNQRQSDGCLVPFFLFSEDFSNQMRMYQF